MQNTVKKVVLTGLLQLHDADTVDGAEVWGVNTAFQKHRNLSRVYFFDGLEYMPDDFSDCLNALPLDTRIISTVHHDGIPRSEPYPLDAVSEHFGCRYWTCSLSYLVAQAIYEGFAEIHCLNMYHSKDSLEYVQHKPCMEYWIGMAIGRGIKVTIPASSMLGKPFPWESPIYGYEVNEFRRLPISAFGAAYAASCAYPVVFKPSIYKLTA